MVLVGFGGTVQLPRPKVPIQQPGWQDSQVHMCKTRSKVSIQQPGWQDSQVRCTGARCPGLRSQSSSYASRTARCAGAKRSGPKTVERQLLKSISGGRRDMNCTAVHLSGHNLRYSNTSATPSDQPARGTNSNCYAFIRLASTLLLQAALPCA